MANLLCESNINFTSSSWKVLDTTSFLNSEAASTNTTTSYVASSTFTPGAITIEGIMIKYRYVVTNSGTLSVDLYNSTAASTVAGSEVTINVSDLAFWMTATSVQTNGGFIYLKFSAPITLLAATNYAVRVKTSTNGSVSINRDATASNWTRALVTSTTASATTDDVLYTCGAFTGTSTPSFITCTMNNTSSTVFGGIELGAYSKFILENNASTAYVLKIKNNGNFICSLNSELEFGTSGSTVQSTSSLLLEMQSSTLANNKIDFRATCKVSIYGTPRIRMTTLNADSAASATSLTTSVSTGWKNGDVLVFGQTARSASDLTDKKSLTADASGTTLTIAAMTNAKLGSGSIKCDIGNLTSNVKIYGTSASQTFYVNNGNINMTVNTTVYIKDVEFRYMGSGGSSNYGLSFQNETTSICEITNSSFSDFGTNGRVLPLGGSSGTAKRLTFENNVIYNVSNALNCDNPFDSTTIVKINNNFFCNNNTAFSIIRITNAINVELNNNIISGCVSHGLSMNVFTPVVPINNLIFDNLKSYGNRGMGSNVPNCQSVIFSNSTWFFNNGVGLYLGDVGSVLVDSCTIFGNSNTNITLGSVTTLQTHDNVIFKDCNINSNTTYTVNYGVLCYSVQEKLPKFINCNFGTSTTHNTSDVYVQYSLNNVFNNCNFGSTTLVIVANNSKIGKVYFQNINGVIGNNKIYTFYGNIFNDTIIYDVGPNSQRIYPIYNYSTTNFKMKSTSFITSVASGSTATVSIKVRKSVIGDGTAYNGNQPRLILRRNPSAGSAYNSDIVCATATAASDGAWETLSYTLPSAVTDNVGMEFYIDCDGTTGWINADTLISNNNNSMTYYMNGEPIIDIPSTGTTETAFTFIN